MNNYNLFLLIALLMTFLMSIFGSYFLIFLEMIRLNGSFRGIKGIVLSLLFAALIITGPVLVLQIGDYARENIPVPYLILDISFWQALIVIYTVILLILIVLVAVKSEGEENDISDNDVTQLSEKYKDENSIKTGSGDLIIKQ